MPGVFFYLHTYQQSDFYCIWYLVGRGGLIRAANVDAGQESADVLDVRRG